MDIAELIDHLKDPAAWPEPPDAVEVRQTHLSVVFLSKELAYKVKKPVDLGFADFSTLEKRRHYCEEEVRLNRRLASNVYLGAVPITREGERLLLEGEGTPLEWAVKMRRLPDAATLEARLERGQVSEQDLERLAKRVALFHAKAERGKHISEFGRFKVVERNAIENIEAASQKIGQTIERPVYDRLSRATREALDRHRDLIRRRADKGVPCDTHGDLHLDHVYLFPRKAPPSDLVVLDCIEFNERFRFADPVADMAFLAMDLEFHDRRDLAGHFAEHYFEQTGDAEGAELLPLYVSYRAAVRAKVDGLKVAESEVPEEERERARLSATAHWLLALGALEAPNKRPGLLVIGGLPGTGKSTLALSLAGKAGFPQIIRSDLVRKELAGLAPTESAKAAPGEGIYTAEWSEKTYAECFRRTRQALVEGERVILDANFREAERRAAALAVARELAVPYVFIECTAAEEVVAGRIVERSGEASDADFRIYKKLRESWEPSTGRTALAHHRVSTEGTPAEAVGRALPVLQGAGLWVGS